MKFLLEKAIRLVSEPDGRQDPSRLGLSSGKSVPVTAFISGALPAPTSVAASRDRHHTSQEHRGRSLKTPLKERGLVHFFMSSGRRKL